MPDTPAAPPLDPAPALDLGPDPASDDLRIQAEAILQTLVGSQQAALREDQWIAIDTLVRQHRRALVVQRTGWGKSAVYFVATALLRSHGAGPTVIVSPLLALMRNQIHAAERAGITARTINSTNPEAWHEIRQAVQRGEIDLLLVSPERLNNPEFRDTVLPDLAESAGLVVVDEAHCISDWGHDFRPDYRRLRTLIAELPAGVPVLATTATANARVSTDVAEQLSAEGAETIVLRGALDRESLHLGVLSLPDQESRLAWLADHLHQIDGSGIIYCLTVAATTEVTEMLTAHGHAVRAYSGQTEHEERLAAEDDLLHNRIKALVATSALGMGFDKPDLAFVIHLGAPSSPIAYYQQVGRAGRGVDRAEVVLLPGQEDEAIWAHFASLAFPDQAVVRQTLEALDIDQPLSTPVLESQIPLSRSRLEMMLKVLDVDGAVRRVRGGWIGTGASWSYDAERYARVARARRGEQQLMRDYIAATQCRMEFLRRALDDPDAAPCGRCDNCGGLRLTAAISAAARERARQRLDRPGVVLAPKKMWPTQLARHGLELTGRIREGAGPGRAVARLTDLGHGQLLRELFVTGIVDGEVPVPLRHAIVRVLDEWEFDAVPTGVVAPRSSSRPQLLDHLVAGLARYRGLPILTRFALSADQPPGAGAANSAHRLGVVARRHRLLDPAAVTGHHVLLIDDRAETGWTLTWLAHQLRRAGAESVHPLVLATTG